MSSALDKTDVETSATDEAPDIQPQNKIVTTDEEIEAFYIIKGLLAGICNLDDIVYRDTESYFVNVKPLALTKV